MNVTEQKSGESQSDSESSSMKTIGVSIRAHDALTALKKRWGLSKAEMLERFLTWLQEAGEEIQVSAIKAMPRGYEVEILRTILAKMEASSPATPAPLTPEQAAKVEKAIANAKAGSGSAARQPNANGKKTG